MTGMRETFLVLCGGSPIGDARSSEALYAEPKAETRYLIVRESQPGPAPKCPCCGTAIGMLEWTPPYRVEIECLDRTFGDMVFGYGSLDILVSERMRDLFRQEQLVGLSGFEEVEIVRIRKRHARRSTVPRYFHTRVAFGRAAIDQVASEFEYDQPWQAENGPRSDVKLPTCPECRHADVIRWKRIIIEPGTWAGEDISIPRGNELYLVSERFRDFVMEHRITNALLIRAEDYWMDFYPEGNRKRAREILDLPLSAELLEKRREDGETWRYCVRTNELVVANADGSIKTMFRPIDGMAFWNRH